MGTTDLAMLYQYCLPFLVCDRHVFQFTSLYQEITCNFDSDFNTIAPPANYVPGLGRGATGFTTRSDIGPARMAPEMPSGLPVSLEYTQVNHGDAAHPSLALLHVWKTVFVAARVRPLPAQRQTGFALLSRASSSWLSAGFVLACLGPVCQPSACSRCSG